MRSMVLESAFGKTPQLLAFFEQGFDVEQGVFEAELRGVDDADVSCWVAFSQHPAQGVDQTRSVVLACIYGPRLKMRIVDSPIGRRYERTRGPGLIHPCVVQMSGEVIPAPTRWAGRRRLVKGD
jgi:hypothetical protein